MTDPVFEAELAEIVAEDTTKQCKQWIATAAGTRQCRNGATHYLPANPQVVTCSTHARSYDLPMPTREA